MKRIILLFVLFTFAATTSFAQDTEKETVTPKKWDQGLGLGLDFTQLLQINPKVGAGQNRIGLGGALTYYANMKQDKHAWDNSISWRIGVQKLGSGIYTGTRKQPFQKSIDELRFDSKYGYAITENKKWYMATELSFLSQVLKTYRGSLLTDVESFSTDNGPISKFLSPGVITYSVGIDFKPNDNFSLYYSPIALKTIIVANDNIASIEGLNADGTPAGISLHGTPWRNTTDFDNTLFLAGSLLKAQYQNKFWAYGEDQHRILFKTYATFFFDYLQAQKKTDNPDYKTNVDVDWGTETSFVIFKGLSVVLTTNLFYDWDVPVQKTDYSQPGAVGGLVRRPSFTQQLLIKYTHSF
ncbi:MAG: opacity protein-like surface antigen [Maribacter sp.]|jgi:opacity protein-like surface antigen